MEITICGRAIGAEYPPFVIAEIGINHGGSLEVAMQMVDAAHLAGAECIKHQTHVIDDEMSPLAQTVIPGNSKNSIYDIMAACALNEAEEIALKNYVESKGMIFISTPFSRAAANRLENMGVRAYKIGSGECNNLPLIEHVAQFGKPMIVSTGMNSLASVRQTVAAIEAYNVPYILMHTTNLYPTPAHLVRLGALVQLKETFSNYPVGLSDHTTGNLACFAAVALGACVLERHFTDSMNRIGPDIVNSMDPAALKALIAGSYDIWQMRGGQKETIPEEQVTMDFAFATVVTIKDIKQGEVFTKENIWVKRPGIGELPAKDFKSLLGKKALVDVACNEHLKKVHIADD